MKDTEGRLNFFSLCSSPESAKPLTKRRKYEEIINAKPFITPISVENTLAY